MLCVGMVWVSGGCGCMSGLGGRDLMLERTSLGGAEMGVGILVYRTSSSLLKN